MSHTFIKVSLTLTFLAIRSSGQYIYDDSPQPTLSPSYYPNAGIDLGDYSYPYYDLEDPCEQRDSCAQMRLGFISYTQKNCYCDDLCQVYSDCCEDFIPSSPEKTLQKLPRGVYSCRLLYGVTLEPNTVPLGLDTVYVVDKCPKEYSDNYFKTQCERGERNDMFANVPVSGQSNGILYRNYFCAICNEVTDLSFWSVSIGCSDNATTVDAEEGGFTVEDTMDALLAKDNCTLTFRHHTHTPRYCKENVISRCHNHWTDKRIKKKCKSGTLYRYAFQKIFRNEFCAQCNYVNTTYLECSDGSNDPNTKREPVPPLSILLDLNTGRGTVTQLRKVDADLEDKVQSTITLRRCLDNHVYDPFARICRLVACRPGYKFQNGECIEDMNGVTPYDPNRKIVASTLQSGGAYDEVDGRFPTQQPSDVNSITAASGMEGINSTTFTKTIDNEMIHYLDCAFMTLKESEYHLMPSGGIYVPLYSKTYSREEYTNITNGAILICSPFTSQNYTVSTPHNESTDTIIMFQYDRIQGLISYIGLLISIICLFVVFVIYMMFPSLRNTPGKCVVSLVVALLLAQVSFLVGGPLRSYPEVCFSLGVLTHYFFLASFFWINILSVGIFRSVSSSNLNEDNTMHFVCASFFGWTTAALIVGVALVLQFIEEVPDMFRPMYGDGVCWITQKWPLLITFVTPVALILVINIILFIGTTIKICLISRASRHIRSDNSQTHQFLLYVKLCLIMGLTWVFGFLAAMTNLSALWYVFIVLNSLHGVYICFAFVCTGRVLGLLSGKGEKNKDRVTGGYNKTGSSSNGTPSWAHTKHSVLDTSFNGNVKVIESRETSI